MEFAKALAVSGPVPGSAPVQPGWRSACTRRTASAQIGMRPGYYQAVGGREDAVVLRRTIGKRRR